MNRFAGIWGVAAVFAVVHVDVVVWLPSEPSFRRPRRSSLMIGVELTPLGLVLTREVLGRILIHLYREVSSLTADDESLP